MELFFLLINLIIRTKITHGKDALRE